MLCSWPPPPLAGGLQPCAEVFFCGTNAQAHGIRIA
jgi:hypothetical protein